ncbi:type I pantothenate kinase [Paenibacillus wulumuqiensis]|uniref:type I pantothenate kinase n=1 Tax=Paenibacillus wulumuqiensis TaxID=1567107 RepID=UPI0006198EC3|nr:type I pantothenate kinase [Paenibacillus wulumuqiensis]
MKRYSPYIEFDRKDWASLRDHHTPLPLTESELEQLRGLNEHVSLQEVEEVYLPLTHLIHLYVGASQQLHQLTTTFLKKKARKTPFIIGIAGSVAVGKSTTARLLQTLLSRWDTHRRVDLVTTDGFLYPKAVLEEKGIMNRKGFPESYDIKRLMEFMGDIKSGKPNVRAPKYSHLTYDRIPDEESIINNPDILIVEGINVLQVKKQSPLFVSDFFDFSIYMDADETNIARWYVERFQLLRQTVFQNPDSYFHSRFGHLTAEEAEEAAQHTWKTINAKNLHENILPTKGRAQLILRKEADHSIQNIFLRKL